MMRDWWRPVILVAVMSGCGVEEFVVPPEAAEDEDNDNEDDEEDDENTEGDEDASQAETDTALTNDGAPEQTPESMGTSGGGAEPSTVGTDAPEPPESDETEGTDETDESEDDVDGDEAETEDDSSVV